MKYMKRQVLCFLMIIGIVCVIRIGTMIRVYKTQPVLDEQIKSSLIKTLTAKYKVDYDVMIHGDPWRLAKSWLAGRHVHPEFTPELGGILKALATKKIISADFLAEGTQMKLLLELEGGQKASFRPKLCARDFINDQIYTGMDLHNGEIAAFHIGRILEFRRAPYVVGRYVNMETEILPVATDALKSIIIKHEGNICIRRYCSECHTKRYKTVCADKAMLEGSIAWWITTPIQSQDNPWRDSNKKHWNGHGDFCYKHVMWRANYTKGPLLLDIVDTAIVDFLIHNPDRHSTKLLRLQNKTMLVMIDNAMSFGNPYYNEIISFIMAPLYQCCVIRESTWHRMLLLKDILGDVLKAVIDQDPIAPILTQAHLDGVNRRLDTAINTVLKCIAKVNGRTVLTKDFL